MIGITVGEHFGISYEILAKSTHLLEQHPCLIYGDREVFAQACKALARSIPDNISWHQISCQAQRKEDKKARAQFVLQQLDQAIEDVRNGKTMGLLTCPIDKNIVRSLRPNFDGHTGYLQQQTRSNHSIMLMRNDDFAIIVGTQHIPLREVANVFTQSYFEALLGNTVASFAQHFQQHHPKIALLGLNPHAGEIDDQAEEKKWMHNSVAKLQQQGVDISGPYPADSFFASAREKGWDLIISPYHDQALIAAKYNGLSNVVNITLGLPFLRTSPGHGVAYDIAGKNLADPASLQRALRVLIEKSLSASI